MISTWDEFKKANNIQDLDPDVLQELLHLEMRLSATERALASAIFAIGELLTGGWKPKKSKTKNPSLDPLYWIRKSHKILYAEVDPWKGGKHKGECIKVPMICMTCMQQDYEEQAEDLTEILENKRLKGLERKAKKPTKNSNGKKGKKS